MRYGPLGLIKALLTTIGEALGSSPKKYSKLGDEEESPWDDIDTYDNNDDPGMKWWKARAQKKINDKELEAKTITKMLIEDYESHSENNSDISENKETDNETRDTSSNESERDNEDTQDIDETGDNDSNSSDLSDTDFSGMDFANIDWDNVDWGRD